MSDLSRDPFGSEKETYHFLTQETRYLILQYILAHPENLPSLEELAHAIPKGKSTIHEHLDKLQERDVVDAYEVDADDRSRDLPSTFYGLTEYGIYASEEFDLLQGKPILQAIYANADKPERIERYENAPRPDRKSEAELEGALADAVEDGAAEGMSAASGGVDEETAKRIAGITNLLDRSEDAGEGEEDVATRVRLGAGLLRLLDSETDGDRSAAVTVLARIGRETPEAVAPVLSELVAGIESVEMSVAGDIVRVVEQVSADGDSEIPESVRSVLGEFFNREIDYWQQDFELAKEILNAGLSIASNLDDMEMELACRYQLGAIADRRGNLDSAEDHFEACRQLGEAAESSELESVALTRLGNLERTRGNLDAAADYFQQSLALYREIGDTHGEATSLNNLGAVEQSRGNLDDASDYHQQSLVRFREIGDTHGEAQSLNNLGLVERNRDDALHTTCKSREKTTMSAA